MVGSPYTAMIAVLTIMSFRRGLPMTIWYCIYPLLGDRCSGWIGDAVDIPSIVTTIAGVCSSLGLGAMQINTSCPACFLELVWTTLLSS